MAVKLKVEFGRCATFRLPNSLCLNGRMQPLSLPDENGVRVAFIELLLDDCYGCLALKKRGEPIQTVLDIGGNVGLFGVMARSSFPEAKIHCYEPNRNLEKYLSIQSISAGFDYFIEAVGLEDGTVTLDFGSDSVLTRSKPDNAGNVSQIAFGKAIERLGGSVDLLKIDCEGAEWDIFEDAASWRQVRHVSMEYHLWPNHTHEEVKNVMQGLGYRINTNIFDPLSNFGLLTASRDD